MSRLVDRIRMNGCQPLKAGRLTSTVTFRAEQLAGATVLVADNVADYFIENFLDKEISVFDIASAPLTPPFQRLFVEMRPSRRDVQLRTWDSPPNAWGVLFETEDYSKPIPEGHKHHGLSPGKFIWTTRWSVKATLVTEHSKGMPIGPVAYWYFLLDPTGRPVLDPDNPEGVVFAGDIPKLQPVSPPVEVVLEEGGSLLPYFAPALLAVAFANCKGIVTERIEAKGRVGKKTKHKTARASYLVLRIDPMRKVFENEGQASTRGLRHALHICRGHFKTFTADAPLFGRHEGTYFWPAHVRGHSEEGIRVKDYSVVAPESRFGAAYREADENITLATTPHDEVQTGDEDKKGRGVRAHAQIQNAVARAAGGAGFLPRSPTAEEPPFDVAWEDHTGITVVEVKSLTPGTEENQLRMGLGQVLRYQQLLVASHEKPARAILAVEYEPADPVWRELCLDHSVTLVTPQGLPELFAATAPSKRTVN
jgi:hypothetical protein